MNAPIAAFNSVMIKRLALSVVTGLILALPFCALSATNPPVTLKVFANKPTHPVSPLLNGVFFEDINFAADGGLYAELVQNRSFEFGPDAFYAWEKVGEPAIFSIENDRPLNSNNTNFLRLRTTQPASGVANNGFQGIAIENNSDYVFSVYARAGKVFYGKLTVKLVSSGGKLLGHGTISGLTQNWKKFTKVIHTSGADEKAKLIVTLNNPGYVDLDMISLFPKHTFRDHPNGLRPDLAQMVANIRPSFVRFPGGCIVEGKNLENRYQWKDTIGDVSVRRQNWNRWQRSVNGVTTPYFQSYGVGFFEFFQFCEDINAEPLPVLNCGMSCQYQDAELVPENQLAPYIQDALDLIDFANGPVTNTWGAKRAAMGHPAPFHLKFIGIGNEQWGEEYFKRYPLFHNAIKAKYPYIQIVTSAGPSPDGKWFDMAQEWFKKQTVDLVDEHYYKPPLWFMENVNRYDNYDRKGPKIFAGEYAAHSAYNRNNLEAALAEAAFMTGLERNSDVVSMSSYAPLFAKIGLNQWPVNLIWFNNSVAYGTPSYYVQMLFSRNRGDVLLPTETVDNRLPVQRLFVTTSRDSKAGQIILKVVNPGEQTAEAEITIEGMSKINPSGTGEIVTGLDLQDENSWVAPGHVMIKSIELSGLKPTFNYTFSPRSATVLRIGQ